MESARLRWRQWWHSRLLPADAITLTQNRIYVLPSRPGLLLAATLLLLLATAINYQLNLGYLLTFLLAGCALVSLHMGHSTLRGLQLSLVAPEPQFAGSSVLLNIKLHNPGRRPRYSIALAVWGSGQWAWTNVPAQGETALQISVPSRQRGVHQVPVLTAETHFPMGSFRIWCLWRPASELLLYPNPETPCPPLPAGETRGREAVGSGRLAAGDFEGVRAYQAGDPLKLVLWKKAAKTGELVSRDRHQTQSQQLWFDLRQTGLTQPEQQLERVCAWVLRADQLGLDYGLRLGATEIAAGSGEAHKKRCLESLARH